MIYFLIYNYISYTFIVEKKAWNWQQFVCVKLQASFEGDYQNYTHPNLNTL